MSGKTYWLVLNTMTNCHGWGGIWFVGSHWNWSNRGQGLHNTGNEMQIAPLREEAPFTIRAVNGVVLGWHMGVTRVSYGRECPWFRGRVVK